MSFATTVVGVITAIGTVMTALALVISALTERRRSKRVESKVDEVHVIVNHQRDVMQQIIKDGADYNRALIRALKVAGVDVPEDQSAID